MKKKMVNDKVIRAMAIGISAVLATAQPMTAFAEEIAPEEPIVEENPSKDEAAKENREAAERAVETADKAVDEVVNSADPIKEAAENLKESINSFNGDGEAAVNDASSLAAKAAEADEKMNQATEQLSEAIKQSEAVSKNKANADKASEAVETVTSEANEAVNAASDKVASYENAIDSANSIDVANQAYNNIVEEVAKANEEVEAAEAEYDRLVKEYNDAVAAISEAQAAYEAAKNAGLKDLSEVTAKLDEAKNNAKAVMEDVRPAKEAAEEAKLRAIAKAKVIDAIAAQKETAAKANNNWRELDKLADLMIKYSLLDNSEVDADSIVLSKWTSDLKDDNCVMATYKLKGSDEVITEFYDYVARNTNDKDWATDYGTYDHIEVVKKTLAYGSANGSKFAGKGEYFGLNESIASFDASKATKEYDSLNKLLNDAEQETLKVDAAQDAVDKIKEKINALESGEYEVDDAEYASLLISYQSRLNAAKTNLKNAQDNLEKLNDEVDKAKANLAATIARLTPAPVRRNNNNNRVPVVQEATPALDFVYAPGVAVAAAPMQMVAGGQGIQVAQVGGNADQADGDFLELEDVQAPLADFAEEEGVNAITLQDEETPLVSFEQEDAKRVMSWWWLLVVAVMGTTGYEMYKKHEEKKKAAETAKKNK